VAAPLQRTPGRRPLPVAVDTHQLRQCLRRTPAVRTPTFWTPTAVPGAAADSQGVRGVRLRQDGGGPAAAVAARRQDRRMLDLLVCAGQVARSTQPAQDGCPDAWTPDAAWRTPGARTPRHGGHPRPPQGMGTPRRTGRSRPICPAHVGCVVGCVGSRRSTSDRQMINGMITHLDRSTAGRNDRLGMTRLAGRTNAAQYATGIAGRSRRGSSLTPLR
jgi:hypothetical protein